MANKKKNENLEEQLEDVANEYLDKAHELVYSITHFITKPNKTTANDVRRVGREIEDFKKSFKDVSIEFFK